MEPKKLILLESRSRKPRIQPESLAADIDLRKGQFMNGEAIMDKLLLRVNSTKAYQTEQSRNIAVSAGIIILALMSGIAAGADTANTFPISLNLPQQFMLPNNLPLPNSSGLSTTYSTNGFVDFGNEFFQDLGANGRRCVSCHQPQEGWSVTPAGLQSRFDLTGGTESVFRTNDGSNSPNADVSSVTARRIAYSLLLTKGLIRVGLGIPENAEFELVAVDDPYNFASEKELSLFRRPLPTTNLKFLSTVMWDGRETFPSQSVHFDLAHQANDATLGHAMGMKDLSPAQIESVVSFETSLTTAQSFDWQARELDGLGAKGGPVNITQQDFYIGINDNLGDSKTGMAFSPVVFNIYDAWSNLSGNVTKQARAAVARGQAIFNTKPISIEGVSGINDEAVFGNPSTVNGTCTTCHDTPNSGNHSVVAPLNIGISDAGRRTPDMPLYTLRNKITGEQVLTTDPGRALISGKWKHIGRFKGPILRGLAARPPYFHNGSAQDLKAVVDFYELRFNIAFTQQEKDDLVAFLRAL